MSAAQPHIVRVVPSGENWPVYIVGPFPTELAADVWAASKTTWAFRGYEREVAPLLDPSFDPDERELLR